MNSEVLKASESAATELCEQTGVPESDCEKVLEFLGIRKAIEHNFFMEQAFLKHTGQKALMAPCIWKIAASDPSDVVFLNNPNKG